MTALCSVLFVVGVSIALAAEILRRKTAGSLDATIQEGRSVARDARSAMNRGVKVRELPIWENPWDASIRPLEARRDQLCARRRLLTKTRTTASLLAAVSGAYLVWSYCIQPAFSLN